MKYCPNQSRMSYRQFTRFAKCAQPPLECPYELSERILLQTGKTVTIFYCAFEPEAEKKKIA